MTPKQTPEAFWQNRPVFITGHTGFKGGWLSLWLHQLGAKIYGYALNPPTEPSFFDAVGLASVFSEDNRMDLADLDGMTGSIQRAQPSVVFHLAAQPLVRESYQQPIKTFADNALGTAHLLEAIRQCPSVNAVVVITTDKVYENQETGQAYQETDRLGGHDPYSASKACAEIITNSLRASFFAGGHDHHPARIATVRAGNVIGGGDWAADRLVPDCLKAFEQGLPVTLRNPGALRPWQHVFEPLQGYLTLAQGLIEQPEKPLDSAWNFGPDHRGTAAVGKVADTLAKHWGDGARIQTTDDPHKPHEANLLSLDSTKARDHLSWAPKWGLEDALKATVDWHRAWLSAADKSQLLTFSLDQLNRYRQANR